MRPACAEHATEARRAPFLGLPGRIDVLHAMLEHRTYHRPDTNIAAPAVRPRARAGRRPRAGGQCRPDRTAPRSTAGRVVGSAEPCGARGRRADPPPYARGGVGADQAQQAADGPLVLAAFMRGRMTTRAAGGPHRTPGGPAGGVGVRLPPRGPPSAPCAPPASRRTSTPPRPGRSCTGRVPPGP